MKEKGWKGFAEGPESGVYSVASLSRLNVFEGMSTPLANDAYKEFFETLGEKPVHYTLANHWTRCIELLNASEKIIELLEDDDIAGKDIRNMPKEVNPTLRDLVWMKHLEEL